ncbi:Hypothetical protein CINCED_3A021200 [Cinara cedri]|uniref:Major facilitator superfamily,Major facilitator superfamily domain n=1 Tax=Cinara cedri TaxID=506608 RepID=A0A5E4MEF5_9HEMI|nr:Hypothetical protein CINCED_3A021200 [Cinara cedri]
MKRQSVVGVAFRQMWNAMTIEPVVMCYMTSFTLVSLTVSNLNLQKACRVNLRMSDATCAALESKSTSEFEGDEVTVQELVAKMMVWQTCLQNLLPCILLLLVGSWSDRTRRRVPFLMLPIYGELVRNAGQLLCVYYFYQLPMGAAGIAETIPLALTGGQTMMTMIAYSYVGDATTVKHRTTRIGGVNAAMAISMALGTSLSGILYNKLGYYGVYGISTVLLIIGLIYGKLYVRDVAPVTETNANKSYKTVFVEFFDTQHIAQSVKTTFKERPSTQRLRILILLIILMTNAGTNNGFRTISYLYTRVRFNWNELKYSIYATYELLINIIGLLFAVFVLNKQLRMSDEIIGMLSTISQSLAALYFGLIAYNEFLFYFGPLVNILIVAENMSIKSLMTKLVPNTELSQIAAIFGIAEIIVSLFFGLLYNGLYEVTLKILPGAVYGITFIFSAPVIGLFYWLYVERKYEGRIPLPSTIDPNLNYGTISKS